VTVPVGFVALAVIVASPGATAVTSPELETLTIALLLLDHVNARPMSTFPFASRTTVVSCVVRPTWRDAVAGDTVIDATGAGVTVKTAVPLTVPLAAVIVEEPLANAFARPDVAMVAILLLLDDQVTARPVRMFPAASRVTAENCTVDPA
jgi:hypothetical protein